MDVGEAAALISSAIAAGRVAHGYLICGDLRGQCDELVAGILSVAFPGAEAQIAAQTHPDIAYLEPEGKSRTIHVKSMRERIIEPMSVTAFSGGWKVGVVVGADRLEDEAANAFLKTLEEPPPKTFFLLLTDQPDAILPTIVSRTQRIDLPLTEKGLEGEAYAGVAEVFNARGVEGSWARMQAGRRLAEILSDLKASAEDADVPIVRKAFYRTVMRFAREWMERSLLPRELAFRNIEAVEDAFRQSERYIPDEPVLCSLADRLSWPSCA